eukprot:364282-Chlamydomonas_euryale.AAC.11
MEDGSVIWQAIPLRDSVVVFDADMRAKKDFFTKVRALEDKQGPTQKAWPMPADAESGSSQSIMVDVGATSLLLPPLQTLEVMADEELMLCLTPQAFHNINAEGDLFNNINKQFWEYWLPGAFAWGYIACTGTNFVIRARALASCGWFPNQTITEGECATAPWGDACSVVPPLERASSSHILYVRHRMCCWRYVARPYTCMQAIYMAWGQGGPLIRPGPLSFVFLTCLVLPRGHEKEKCSQAAWLSHGFDSSSSSCQ